MISVILPTYNPDIERLNRVLSSLSQQTLASQFWELIIIDNNSSTDFESLIYEQGFQLKVIKETTQGLTFARLRGFKESKKDLIVMVDDDNLLDKNYLKHVISIFAKEPNLAAIGGKSEPVFESEPPSWLKEFYGNLALRDLGEKEIIKKWENKYPSEAPIGAGMALRRKALESYINKIERGEGILKDRTGQSLSSGGDNDIVIEILNEGWQVGYFPILSLKHIIPKSRMELNYLAKLVHDINKSWIQLLESHKINPWNPISRNTLMLRKAKSFFTHSVWKGKANYLRWKAACGLYDGLASI